MALSSWWQEMDALPVLPTIAGFRAKVSTDVQLLAQLAELEPVEVEKRLAGGHCPYIAYFENTPVAYGWVARQKAEIGELKLSFKLPPHNRYLWDFQTLPEWRGRGIYPHLLQTIITIERQQGGEHLWIISAPENEASSIGIARAGFVAAGEILFLTPHEAALLPISPNSNSNSLHRASVGAALLGLNLFETQTKSSAECWHCMLTSPLGCQCQLTRESDLESCASLCKCAKA